MEDLLELLLGTGVVTSLGILAWQRYCANKAEDERMLAQARVLLVRLINLRPNDPFTPIHSGNSHQTDQSVADWRQRIADTRVELENTALAIRSKRLVSIAAQVLEVAEPPLEQWNEDLAAFLVGQIKVVLGPKVVDARKDPHALDPSE